MDLPLSRQNLLNAVLQLILITKDKEVALSNITETRLLYHSSTSSLQSDVPTELSVQKFQETEAGVVICQLGSWVYFLI